MLTQADTIHAGHCISILTALYNKHQDNRERELSEDYIPQGLTDEEICKILFDLDQVCEEKLTLTRSVLQSLCLLNHIESEQEQSFVERTYIISKESADNIADLLNNIGIMFGLKRYIPVLKDGNWVN